jgi:hypothetical protein
MSSDTWSCPVCMNTDISGLVKPHCGHDICFDCYSEIRNRNSEPCCVLCRGSYRKTPVTSATAAQVSEPITTQPGSFSYHITSDMSAETFLAITTHLSSCINTSCDCRNKSIAYLNSRIY